MIDIAEETYTEMIYSKLVRNIFEKSDNGIIQLSYFLLKALWRLEFIIIIKLAAKFFRCL
jgi:hypothetical protein